MFCIAKGLADQLARLSDVVSKHWPKASLQLWMTDMSSDDGLLQEQDYHGKSVLIERGSSLADVQRQIAAALRTNEDHSKLSMISGSVSPLLVLCCTRIGFPLPAQLIADL
jgi:hypothetical protein